MKTTLPILTLTAIVLWAGGMSAATWEPEQVEVPTSGTSATLGVSGRPAAVDADGVLHLVYQSSVQTDQFELAYTRRESGGVWTAPEVISPPGRSSRNASVFLDAVGRLHVIWEDISDGEGDIAHRIRETDGSWGEMIRVAWAPGFSKQPVITVDAFGRPHAVWIDGRSSSQEIYHSIYELPVGWQDPPQLLSLDSATPGELSIDADGLGNVHVVWSDRGTVPGSGTSWDIVYVRLDPATPETVDPVRLVDHTNVALRPFLEATEDGVLHLVWLDDRVPTQGVIYEIFYKRFLPDIGWGRDKRFTYDVRDHARPIIVAGPGQSLNVAWEDFLTGNPEIFYRQITDAYGWDPHGTRLTVDSSASQAPALVTMADGGMVILWTDAQGSGTFRVFAKDGQVEAP